MKITSALYKVREFFSGEKTTHVVPFGNHSYGPQPKILGYMPWLPYLIKGTRIGKYCALAPNITFAFYGKHDYSLLTTYPFGAFYEEWQTDVPTAPEFERGVLHPEVLKPAPIIIENDVWIAHDVTIRQGVKIGSGAVVALYSLVVKDVPPYAIVGGNPAKIIRYRFTEEQISALLSIAWWDWPDEKVRKMLPLMLSHDIDKFIRSAKSMDRL